MRISLPYLLLQFPPVVLLVVQHALFITAFLKWMIDVISFCLYLLNEMRRNLIKITSHAILGGSPVLTGFANDVTCDLNSLHPNVHWPFSIFT